MTLDPKPGYFTNALDCLSYKFRDDYVNTQCLNEHRSIVKKFADEIQNGIIVEIGVLGGATLLSLYDSAVKNHNVIYGIDPFDKINLFNGRTEGETEALTVNQTKRLYRSNRKNLEGIIAKYNLGETIKLIPESSSEAVKLFKDNSIDLLHIDGDHSTEGVFSDLEKYYPKMKKGKGIIIGDDFEWGSVKAGLEKFCDLYNVLYNVMTPKFVIKC